MLRKILTYSILQQEASAPLNANSSTEAITGVGFPLPQDDSKLTRGPHFSHLFNSRGKDKIGFMDDADSSNQADQALKKLRIMYKSGAVQCVRKGDISTVGRDPEARDSTRAGSAFDGIRARLVVRCRAG